MLGVTLQWTRIPSCKVKSKVCIRANVAHQAGAYPGFCSMKRLGVFLLPLACEQAPVGDSRVQSRANGMNR